MKPGSYSSSKEKRVEQEEVLRRIVEVTDSAEIREKFKECEALSVFGLRIVPMLKKEGMEDFLSLKFKAKALWWTLVPAVRRWSPGWLFGLLKKVFGYE